jgi:hypothetical protein
MIDQLKESIKEKWLTYYESNISWLKIAMEKNGDFWTQTEDGGRRPNSHLIIGVITSLDPNLSSLMSFSCQLNSDADDIIKSLGLNFNPEDELEKREKEKEKKIETPNSESKPPSALSDTEYLDQIRQKNNQTE